MSRTATTQKICWAASWGTPCQDYAGRDLDPQWRVQTMKQVVICCDAHLPSVLRRCALPAEVHAAPTASVRPPGYVINDPGFADVVGKEDGEEEHTPVTQRVLLPSTDDQR